MNSIFYDFIDVFLVVYIDDLLIFSKKEDDHFLHLETVLSQLSTQNLYVGRTKCEFFRSEVEFLVLKVSSKGLSIRSDRIDIIQTWPKPSNLKDLRSFIGLLQFFRRFIKDFSSIAAPLTNFTRKGVGIDKWDPTCDRAVQLFKDALTTSPILISPDWKMSFRFHVDASQFAVGGVLAQTDEKAANALSPTFQNACHPQKRITQLTIGNYSVLYIS